MIRHTVRRAAALAATGTLAVLIGAGPALAADNSPAAVHAASAGVAAVAAPADPQPILPPVPCYPHPGLLSSLLWAVGDLLGALL